LASSLAAEDFVTPGAAAVVVEEAAFVVVEGTVVVALADTPVTVAHCAL